MKTFMRIFDGLGTTQQPAKVVKEREEPVFTRGPAEGVANVFSEVDGQTFCVRGKTYMKDSVKHWSQETVFELLEMELFNSANGKVNDYADRPESSVARYTANGDKRFKFSIVFQTPTTHLVITWAVRTAPMEKDPPFARLWEDFLNGDDHYRNDRLKCIPRIVSGNMLLRRIVGEKPGILGRRLKIQYRRTDQYLEALIDCVSSNFGAKVINVCCSHATSLAIDLAFVLEGRSEDELPERVFGSLRMSKPNLLTAKVLE